MERKIALVLSFALGLAGGGTLAAGWYATTASGTEAARTSETGRFVGGAHPAAVDPGHVAPRAGMWIVSDGGVLTWVTVEPGASLPAPAFRSGSSERGPLDELAKDIECQMNGCSDTR